MHYFQFEIKEWVSNTAHLSLEEEAAYFRLIMHYYDSEKPISNSELSKVFRRCRIPEPLGCFVLSEFFQCEDEENWIHKRCDIEIAKYHAKSEQASRAGKASAQRRLNGRSTDVQPIINQESIINNHKSNKALDPPEGVSVDLWNDFLVYRKRMKAPVTARVLVRLVKEADLAKMTLSDVLETIIFKGWKSFDATWITQKTSSNAPQSAQACRTNYGLMMAKATELGLHTIGLQRFEIINKIDATIRSRGL